MACVFVAGATIIACEKITSVVLVGSIAIHSPVVLLYYMVCFFIMADLSPEILYPVASALGLYNDMPIPGTPIFWMLWLFAIFSVAVDRPMRLIGATGISTATGLLFAPGFTMLCWLCLLLFAVVLVPYTIVCCIGAVAMFAYPWLVQKNWTLRWRRLLLYRGQSYRNILLSFACYFRLTLYTSWVSL